jgi:hypothetical protein
MFNKIKNWLLLAIPIPIIGPMSFDDVVSYMPMNTSPGFPFSKKFKAKRDMPDELIIDEIMSCLDCVPSSSLFGAFNKEEIREFIKGKLKDTRQINGGSLKHYSLGRLIFGWLHEYFVTHWRDLPFAVGYNAYRDYHDIMAPFAREEFVFCLDQSKQDAGFLARMMFHIYDLWRLMLNRPKDDQFNCFVYDEIFSLILVNDMIVRTFGGNKSGSPSTLYSNCFQSLFCVTAAYIKAGYDYDKWYDDLFVRKVVSICGDDVLMGSSTLTREQIREGYEVFGAQLSLIKRPFLEIEFCASRPAMYLGRIVRTPLDPLRLLASAVYKSSNNPVVVLSQVASFRINCVFMPYWFDLFTDMAFFIKELHDWRLKGDREWESAKCQIMSKHHILRMHLGFE